MEWVVAYTWVCRTKAPQWGYLVVYPCFSSSLQSDARAHNLDVIDKKANRANPCRLRLVLYAL